MTQRSKIDVLELENFFSDQKQILQDTRSERRAVDRTFCWRLSNVQRLLLPSLLLNVILLGLNLVQMFGLASIQGNKYRASISTWSPPSISSSPSKIIRSNVTGYIPYEKIFGHVHIAKSAGTEINGELAAHYERVCGHKGYSYDAVQFNQRVKTMVESTGVADLNKVGGPDLISNKYKDFNRGRVKPDIMQEIGFEDCDYVSLELPWDTWTGIAQMWPLELHVPCRDPLDHLMSQCNHRKKEFDCDSNDIPGQVDDCLIGADRFDNSLIQMNHLTLKCFNPIPIEPYLEYMNRYLQKKRIQTSYVHRTSNLPRIKASECIWKNKAMADLVLKILNGYDYYRWCQQCMGSQNDLMSAGG